MGSPFAAAEAGRRTRAAFGQLSRADVLLAPFVLELTYLVEARPSTRIVRVPLQDSAQDLDRSSVVAELHVGVDQHCPSLYRSGVPLDREREQRKRFLRESPCVEQAKRQPLQVNLIEHCAPGLHLVDGTQS